MKQQFWTVVENLFFPIPDFIKNAFNSEGYGNALSFQAVDREKIKEIETQIQQNGIAIERELDKSMDMDCEIHNDNLIEIFGDRFAKNPSQFRFRDGDIILIEGLVDRVKQIVDKGELQLFKYEIKRKRSKRKYHLDRIANQKDVQEDEPDVGEKCNKSIAMLKEKLFNRVKVCFEQYSVDRCTEQVEYIELLEDRNIVDVQICRKNGIQRIYGTIVCPICREQKEKVSPLRVYYRESDESSSFWVVSNYTKHLKQTHQLKPIHTKIQQSNTEAHNENVSQKTSLNGDCESFFIVQDSDENMSMKNIDLNDVDVQTSDENWLYTQLADQITEMIQAVLWNGDVQDQMAIKLAADYATANLTVAHTVPDGNCLYSAIAHQLYRHPIDSKEHEDATAKLRAEVVEHILDPVNFHSYQFALQDRVYEIKSADQIQNMTTECKLYVRHVLSKDGKWGGYETINAIINMHKVNILIFNEEGTCIWQTNADEKYDKTIALAYRLGMGNNGEAVRNHYDSVCDMSSDNIWAATDLVIKRMK